MIIIFYIAKNTRLYKFIILYTNQVALRVNKTEMSFLNDIKILANLYNLSENTINSCILQISTTLSNSYNFSKQDFIDIIMEQTILDFFSPKLASKIVYNKFSNQIASKITKDFNKNTQLETKLSNYTDKFKGQHWVINKKSTLEQYSKFTNYIPRNVDIFLDIGCGDGQILSILANEFNIKRAICCDVEDVRTIKNQEFLLIEPTFTLNFEENSVDIVSIFHTLHHMIDAIFRLKVGGFLFLKDHNVVTEEDAQNVSFEHFVYSIGEGKATINDKENYQEIEPMFYYTEAQVTKFLEAIGFKKLYVDLYNNPTKTYVAIYKKL